MQNAYLFQQEVLGFRPYIMNRLKEQSSDPTLLEVRLDDIVYEINSDFLTSDGNNFHIKDFIDDIFDDP